MIAAGSLEDKVGPSDWPEVHHAHCGHTGGQVTLLAFLLDHNTVVVVRQAGPHPVYL